MPPKKGKRRAAGISASVSVERVHIDEIDFCGRFFSFVKISPRFHMQAGKPACSRLSVVGDRHRSPVRAMQTCEEEEEGSHAGLNRDLRAAGSKGPA